MLVAITFSWEWDATSPFAESKSESLGRRTHQVRATSNGLKSPSLTFIDDEFITITGNKNWCCRWIFGAVVSGKAFSYFASSESWIQEVFYHPVAADHPLCFLKSRCTPSQNVRRIQHKLWVALEKSTGSVKSAYCSCFAGYVNTQNLRDQSAGFLGTGRNRNKISFILGLNKLPCSNYFYFCLEMCWIEHSSDCLTFLKSILPFIYFKLTRNQYHISIKQHLKNLPW